MTTAQVIFVIALSVAAVIIVAFALFVVSSTMWGDRWVRAPKNLQELVKSSQELAGKDAS